MNSLWNQVGDEAESLMDDVKALLHATADATDHHVVAARKRLVSSMGKAGTLAGRQLRHARKFVQDHTYETALMAGILGVVLSCLVCRRSCD